MKKFLILLLFISMFVLFGCETNKTQNKDNDDKNEEVEPLEFEGVTFTDMNVVYDGKPHTILVKGAPDFATVEYVDAGPYIDEGEYEIIAVVSAEGYIDLELTATLTISSGASGIGFEEYNRYIVNKPYDELPHTVEMDIKLNSGVNGEAGALFSNLDWVVYGGSTGVGRVFHIGIVNGELKLIFTNIYGTREEITFSGVDLRTGKWINVALTIDSVKRVALLYVDGVFKLSKPINAELSDLIKETKYHVGGDNRTLNPYWFRGEMRQLSVFSNVKSEAEIKYDYENGVDLDEEGLIAQYNLTSNRFHQDIEDNSGNGYWVRYEDTWYDEDEAQMAYDHSFAFVGDTQMLNYWGDADDMDTLYNWIVNNVESQKIGHVFGLGDITETWIKTEAVAAKEWGKAQKAIYQMNGKVSYSLIRGNHDESGRFNEYFNQTPYKGQMSGFFNDKIDTGYKVLRVGNTDYLFMCLDFGASDAELEWAGEIVSQYPNHKVIVTTHGYLDQEGNAMGEDYPHSPSDASDFENDPNYNHGKGIWEKFVSQYENIIMIVGGHINDEDIVYSQKYGVHGNVVTQILIDFQDVDKQLVQSKGQETAGIVVMMYMSEDGSKAELLAYSTIRDKYYKKYNHFTINLNGVCENGHKLTHHDGVDATCTTEGVYEYNSCSRCGTNFDVDGNVLQDLTIKATGHKYDDGVVNGSSATYTCEVCGDSYEEYLDYTIVVNHLYLDGSVASAQEVKQVSKGSQHTINAKTISGYLASQEYVKVHVLNKTNTVNFYYSSVKTWDGSSVSTSLKGSGTQADPYLIESGADLAYIANVVNAHTQFSITANSTNPMYLVYQGVYFKLTNNIDLGGHKLQIGYYSAWNNYSVFDGILEGNNCSIKGINISSTTFGTGLFGGIGIHGEVKNLSVHGTVKSTVGTTGGLTCWLEGKLINCTNYVNVTGVTDVGGLVGNAETKSQILNSVNYGNINGSGARVGGVAGTGKSILTYCTNYGNVTSTSTDGCTGGVVGAGTSQDTTSLQSYLVNYGTVTGVNTTGGIIGLSFNKLENCTNYGAVKASSWNIGGIVGRVSNTSKVTSCTNNGAISTTADCIGGLVGTNQGTLQNSVNNGSVAAKTKIGGIVFENSGTVSGCTNNGVVAATITGAAIDGICQSNKGTITNCVDNAN